MAPLAAIAEAVGDDALLDMDAWLQRDEVKSRIESVLTRQPVQHWLELFSARGLWAARVRSTREAVDELRADGSDLIVEVEGPDGEPVELIGCAIRMSGTPWRQRLAPPRIGQHNVEVLSEVLSPEEVERVTGGE